MNSELENSTHRTQDAVQDFYHFIQLIEKFLAYPTNIVFVHIFEQKKNPPFLYAIFITYGFFFLCHTHLSKEEL